MWESLTDTDRLSEILAGAGENTFNVILKHSPRCAFSAMAKNRIERRVDSRLSYYLIDVLAHRNVSDQLAKITQTRHESPQAFLFEGGNLIEVKSHLGISPEEISRRLDSISRS